MILLLKYGIKGKQSTTEHLVHAKQTTHLFADNIGAEDVPCARPFACSSPSSLIETLCGQCYEHPWPWALWNLSLGLNITHLKTRSDRD